MRNKNRIKPFLNKLEKLWLKYPDLRFGQILHALRIKMNKDDTFYLEEDEWTRVINKLLEYKK